jgi:hypothetical protein
LNKQKLHQQPRNTTPRLRNSKIHTNGKEIGEKCTTTKNGHQINKQEAKNQSYDTADTTERTADLES